MIHEHRPSVDYMALLRGAIARAAERLGLTPEAVALCLVWRVNGFDAYDAVDVAGDAVVIRKQLRDGTYEREAAKQHASLMRDAVELREKEPRP
jgi:hypothetical protein